MVLPSILALGSLAPPPDEVRGALSAIRGSELRAHVRFLASDELRGRALGHAGNETAAVYLASALEGSGVEPLSGYFQPFEVVTSSLETASLSAHRGAAEVRHDAGEDFHPLHLSASATVTAGLVFAGYGIAAPELGYDDYAGLDVEGKVVIAFEHEPQELSETSRFAGRASTAHARPEAKVRAAVDRGAVGLLLAPDIGSHPGAAPALDFRGYWPEHPSELDERYSLAEDLPTGFVAAKVSLALAEKLLNESLGARQRAIEQALAHEPDGPLRGAGSFGVNGFPVTLVARMKREHRPVKNVVGYVEGADPSLRGDRVIVGAHFDHEGVDSTGQIYNGADDNASGTAGVLELAEAFLELKAQGHRPRRTVVFALWNGEERGLLGSTYYVRHPMPENGRTFAYLNLDMIGRSEEVPDPSSISGFHGLERTTAAENANRIHLIGYSFHPWLAGRVAAANQQIGLTLEQKRDPPELGFVRTSDHWSFLARDIPAVFLYTGEHPQVHQPEDDLERIDFAKMEKIVRLAFLTLWSLANEP